MMERVRKLNDREPREGAKYVLYWAQMNRRVESNHALAFAVDLANQQGLPLLFYEGLTCAYPFANDRLHTFLLEGVPETARRLAKLGIGYLFHLRKRRDDPNDTLYKLAADAAAVVTDDYPAFIAAEHNRSVPARLDIPYYAVDSSCIVPMSHFEKQEYAGYTIRPKIQNALARYLVPVAPIRIKKKWDGLVPSMHCEATDIPRLVADCEIDHSVAPSMEFRGGRKEAERRLKHFLENNLRRYAKTNNQPSERSTSNLSPYLHFGHISSLEVALVVKEYAAEHKLIVDEFLEELIVRRELAFNFARFGPRPDTLAALPAWARATLRKHAKDKRDQVYTRDRFERAETHDPLWNAAQREMLHDGKIHGYYRMYWGKKIIEWSATHQQALDTMIYLHDKYALDGRDPNTYTNILWCFGLHDRPWSERPIFGMVRYMSLDGMKRKTDVEGYIKPTMRGSLL
ncbi:MAG TPA: deoxyribodipyrimidine photo-lyase [Bryobacteraceae bacterium]|jgi:deoxyribodipyrimidine photo-lyase|nr:deoxyribodipyrimidine photo-lyase [Bryobacteraceae bacterium]